MINQTIKQVLELGLIQTGGHHGIISKSSSLDHLPLDRVEQVFQRIQPDPEILFNTIRNDESNYHLFEMIAKLILFGHDELECVCDCVIDVSNQIDGKKKTKKTDEQLLFRKVDAYFPKLNSCIVLYCGRSKRISQSISRFKSIQGIIPIVVPFTRKILDYMDHNSILKNLRDYISWANTFDDLHPLIKMALEKKRVILGRELKNLSNKSEDHNEKTKQRVSFIPAGWMDDYRYNGHSNGIARSKLYTAAAKYAIIEEKRLNGKNIPIFCTDIRIEGKYYFCHLAIGNSVFFIIDDAHLPSMYYEDRIIKLKESGYKIFWKHRMEIFVLSLDEIIDWVKESL